MGERLSALQTIEPRSRLARPGAHATQSVAAPGLAGCARACKREPLLMRMTVRRQGRTSTADMQTQVRKGPLGYRRFDNGRHDPAARPYRDLYHRRMDAISYSTARANLAKTMDKVCDNHAAIIITRQRDASVVMISLDDYQALEETAYLLRSPTNARRLLGAIERLATGQGQEKSLEE